MLCTVGAVVVAVIGASPATARLAGTLPDGHSFNVEIQRTDYGIPHILAHDYGSLGYGYGYAFAQDNLCEMADRVTTLRGERSRYFGADGTTNDNLAPADTNLVSDIYYQRLLREGTVARLAAHPAPLGPTPQLRSIVDGYVAGYNRYLHDTGIAHLPDLTCRGKAWVTPITALDVWTNIYDIDLANGLGDFRQEIATAAPRTDTSRTASKTTAVPAALTDPASREGDVGSNGWALGRDVTRDHDGMLLANPHLPWYADARFYQVQLTIPGVLNVSGASIYGTPAVEIGHTFSLAWTQTVSGAQHFSLYRLHLLPGHPTRYIFNGKPVAMTRQTVPVTIRGSDGKRTTTTRTLYASRYGPVLATGWTAATAYTIRDANADNIRSMNEWLAMDHSQNLAQLQAAQRAYQGIPWTYTLAADTSGTTYFTDSSVVPHLTARQAKRCTTGSIEGIPTLDGSTSACDWGSEPDAIEPGLFGPASDPKLTRTDYVANSNNSPYLTNPAAPLTGYPGMFDTQTHLNPRPQLSLQMIAQRVAGTDGLGHPGFTLPTLQATMLGNRNYTAETSLADVLAMCRAHPVLTASDGASVNVRPACPALAHWDKHANVDSQGAVLWSNFFNDLYGDNGSALSPWWRVPYNPAHPLTTPRGVNGNNRQAQHALADAVEQMNTQHLPLDTTPGRTQRWNAIPLPGCSDAEGCFNVVRASATAGDDGALAHGQNWAIGSSFIMATELTPSGPRTRTILTYSESSNPASPHYSDQTVLFSRERWVTERFTPVQINADPHLQTTVLHG
jgi:acyl-homoserine-lactone acylase